MKPKVLFVHAQLPLKHLKELARLDDYNKSRLKFYVRTLL